MNLRHRSIGTATQIFCAIAAAMLLGACAIVPVDVFDQGGQGQGDGFCPPGQAKKGNCRAQGEGTFCPPGQAKKGNC